MEYTAVYACRKDNTIETFGLPVSGRTFTEAKREAKIKAIQYDWRLVEIRKPLPTAKG